MTGLMVVGSAISGEKFKHRLAPMLLIGGHGVVMRERCRLRRMKCVRIAPCAVRLRTDALCEEALEVVGVVALANRDTGLGVTKGAGRVGCRQMTLRKHVFRTL